MRPLSNAATISDLHGLDVEAVLGEIPGIFGNPNGQVGGGGGRPVKNSPELLSFCSPLETHRAAEGKQYEKGTSHCRASALSKGPLSRNSSGRPMNSFATARRLAKSLSTFSIPLSGT